MNIDKCIAAIVFILILVFAIPAAYLFKKVPNTGLTPAEQELTRFSAGLIAMPSPYQQAAFSGLSSPVKEIPKQGAGSGKKEGWPFAPHSAPTDGKSDRVQPATPGTAVTAKPSLPRSLGSLPTVSMIYYSGSTRTAIVDGQIVKEGSPCGTGVIVRIEQTRLLLRKGGKDIWLTTQ